MKRFAIMAVLGAMVCGSLVAGCGNGDTTEETTTNSANGTTSTTTTEKDE